MQGKWIMLSCLLAGAACAADHAGEVVFALGDVTVRQGQTVRPLHTGDKVYAGDLLQTGSNGHVHVRTVDQGFLSVRPASRLFIEQYRYEAAQPASSSIRFRLEQGVMRSVTGKGGQAAKGNFRLNTPVAAIGIRGTDFSVYTDRSETRVSVQQGGVAVSPFTDTCRAEAAGPCAGQSVANLYAGISDQILRLRLQDGRPVILHDASHSLSPESVAPPLPEEKASQPTETAHVAKAMPLPLSDLQLVDVMAGKQDLLPSDTSSPAPGPVPQSLARLDWGRWAGQAGAGSDATYEPIYNDPAGRYTLVRTRQPLALPERGSFDFKLAAADAEVRMGESRVAAAEVSNARLTVDFGKREFQTSLTVTSEALSSPVDLKATGGGVSQDGRLNANQYYQGNMRVRGALSGDGRQAGYIFSHAINEGGLKVVGATQWKRSP